MVLLNGSANRDERHFPDGDSFDIHREIGRHQAFGYGIHLCLGMALARLEGRVALDEVLPALPRVGGRLRQGPAGPDLDRARLGDAARAHVVTHAGPERDQERSTHEPRRHDPGQHRRPHDRAAAHVREPRAEEVVGPRRPRSCTRTASTSGCSRARRPSTSFGMSATVGWPREEWGFNPGTYTELRPGCFDVHERVRDMNANGVLGSMCFPTMAGWNARTFAEAQRQGDRARHAAGLQRLGHRRVVRRLPGPLHPARHRPHVGRRRRGGRGAPGGQEGLPLHQLPRDPARAGVPELPLGLLGPDARGALRREHGAVAAHRRRASPSSGGPRRRRSTTSWCWPARSAPSRRRTCCSGRPCAASPS